MKLGITTIQRNRGPWIVEWLAFHMMVGFDSFIFYAHKCTDDTVSILRKLKRDYSIIILTLDDDDKPQLGTYKHSLDNYCSRVDWMAFIDGDEFLFPTRHRYMADALAAYDHCDLSALGVYWMCYGSSGHIKEPDGLLLENFPRHSSREYISNRHIKSIVRGGQEISEGSAHFFLTSRGTFDEQLRQITCGFTDLEPSYETFRINHYQCQSYEYFMQTKGTMGTIDGNSRGVLGINDFLDRDRNECDDGISSNFLMPLKLKMQELQAVIDSQ